MKTRHDDRYENDPTPSRIIAERYREVILEDDHEASLALIHYRGGLEEFSLGIEYCQSADPLDRELGARILAQLGWSDQTFLDESVDRLIVLLGDADLNVIAAAAFALGHRSVDRAIPHLLQHADHQDAYVRFGVVYGLSGSEDPNAIVALIKHTSDEDHDVRNWAVFGLGTQTECDSPAIREALWASLADADMEVRGEALVGLAKRKDPRSKDAILSEWEHDDIGILSLEAAEELGDPELLESLQEFQKSMNLDDDPCYRKQLLAAVTACEKGTGEIAKSGSC